MSRSKSSIILAVVATVMLATGCTRVSHSGNLTASGKVFKIGGQGYNILYVNGLLSTNIVRENAEMVVETSDNDALGNPADVKGIRSIRFKQGPIISGYLVDLAKKAPDTATAYVQKMGDLSKVGWDSKATEPAKESSTISKPIEIVEKLKEIVSGEYKSPLKGDGEYTDLYKDKTISYQASLCTELLAKCDSTTEMGGGSEETIRDTLIHYAGRLAQLKAKGKDTTERMQLWKVTITNGKVSYLRYRLVDLQDGTATEEVCPSCYGIED